MSEDDSEIDIQLLQEFGGVEIDVERLGGLVRFVCGRFGCGGASVSVAVVGDEKMIEVNCQFLDHNHATDVISFDLSDAGGEGKSFELVVNGERAAREANSRGHDGQAEVALYITHGLLHNLGFDDADERGAIAMHAMEDEILEELGFGAVYRG